MSTTIYRCPECAHPSVVHASEWSGPPPRVGPCSIGGCACRLKPAQVESMVDPVEVRAIPPIYSEATGKWLRR